jgi:hypothetical protein
MLSFDMGILLIPFGIEPSGSPSVEVWLMISFLPFLGGAVVGVRGMLRSAKPTWDQLLFWILLLGLGAANFMVGYGVAMRYV